MRRLWRCTAYLSLTIVLSMVIAAISIRVYMIRVRNKAQVVQAQALELLPGQSTRNDVDRLVRRNQGSLAGEYCDLNHCSIVLSVSSWTSHGGCHGFSGLAEFFGMTAFTYDARVDIASGMVTRIESGVFQNPCRARYLRRNVVVAELIEVDKFRPDALRTTASLARHLDYALCGAKSRRERDYLLVGLSEDTARLGRTRELNLSCLSSFRGCSVPELLPVAYSDWQADVGV